MYQLYLAIPVIADFGDDHRFFIRPAVTPQIPEPNCGEQHQVCSFITAVVDGDPYQDIFFSCFLFHSAGAKHRLHMASLIPAIPSSPQR